MDNLVSLSKEELLARLSLLRSKERKATAEVVVYLAEVDRRRLYLESACSSLHSFCIERLGYSEDAAMKRMRVARLVQELPQVLDELESGAIHLTGLFLLSNRLTADNVEALLAETRGKKSDQPSGAQRSAGSSAAALGAELSRGVHRWRRAARETRTRSAKRAHPRWPRWVGTLIDSRLAGTLLGMSTRWGLVLLVGALLACKQFSKDEKPAASGAGVATAESVPVAPEKKNAAGGVWRGKFKSKRYAGSVLGLVTESGDARFVTYGGVQFVGTVKTDGDKLSGLLTGYQNHKAGDPVTLDGTVVSSKSLVGTFKGGGDSGSFDFAYEPSYDRPASLGEVADKWANVNFAMVANEKGHFQGKDAAGCEYTGAFSVAHEGFNAFNLSFSVSGCKYNGEYKGLATLTDQGGAKSRLAYGVNGDAYSHAGVLFRGELIGSDKARLAILEAEKAGREGLKSAAEARKAADKATLAADRATNAKSASEATKAAGEASKAAGEAAKAAGEIGKNF